MSDCYICHTLIYTSELLILCFTVCVHSATRHNIYMYPAHARGLKKVFISSAVDVVSGIILNAKTDLSKRDIIGDQDAAGSYCERCN